MSCGAGPGQSATGTTSSSRRLSDNRQAASETRSAHSSSSFENDALTTWLLRYRELVKQRSVNFRWPLEASAHTRSNSACDHGRTTYSSDFVPMIDPTDAGRAGLIVNRSFG